jgi:hypothetical protein
LILKYRMTDFLLRLSDRVAEMPLKSNQPKFKTSI